MKRVVTGLAADGTSVIVADGEPPRSVSYANGTRMTYCWATSISPAVADSSHDPTLALESFMPAPDGTTFAVTHIPGLWAGGLHETPTVDYLVVLAGEIWLVLDGGAETLLSAGDVVVQNAARHAWHNRRPEPCVLAAIMIGATARHQPSD